MSRWNLITTDNSNGINLILTSTEKCKSMNKTVYGKIYHHKNKIACSYNQYSLQTLCRRDSKSTLVLSH
jgi:hypothetical protein